MIAVATEASIATPEITRLVNSITAWYDADGTSWFASQVGQCGQPSPDAVSRTRPPVVTTSQSSARGTSAAVWKPRADTAAGGIRASELTAVAIGSECRSAGRPLRAPRTGHAA